MATDPTWEDRVAVTWEDGWGFTVTQRGQEVFRGLDPVALLSALRNDVSHPCWVCWSPTALEMKAQLLREQRRK